MQAYFFFLTDPLPSYCVDHQNLTYFLRMNQLFIQINEIAFNKKLSETVYYRDSMKVTLNVYIQR